MSVEAIKFIKGVLIGGLFSLISLGLLIGLFVEAMNEELNVLMLLSLSIAFVVSVLLTLWGAGFWGRWGLILFFAFLPVVLIADATINPFFPLGAIIVAAVCYWPNKLGKVNT